MKLTLSNWKKAYVLFKDSDLIMLKPLKKGKRHCSLLLQNKEGFLYIDPLLGWTQIIFTKEKDTLKKFKKEYKILQTKFYGPSTKWYFFGFSCVGLIKKILGIRKFWILTPSQLYRFLNNH